MKHKFIKQLIYILGLSLLFPCTSFSQASELPTHLERDIPPSAAVTKLTNDLEALNLEYAQKKLGFLPTASINGTKSNKSAVTFSADVQYSIDYLSSQQAESKLYDEKVISLNSDLLSQRQKDAVNYYNALTDFWLVSRKIPIQEEIIHITEKACDIYKEIEKAGVLSKLEKDQYCSTIPSKKYEYTVLFEQHKMLKQTIEYYIQKEYVEQTEPPILEIASNIEIPSDTEVDLSKLPDLVKYQAAINISRISKKISQNQFWPSLRVSLSSSDKISAFLLNPVWTLTSSISYSILNIPQKTLDSALKDLEILQAEKNYTDAVKKAVIQYQQNLSDFQTMSSNAVAKQELLVQASSFKNAQKSLSALGLASKLNELSAILSENTANLQMLEARASKQKSVFLLKINYFD